MSKEISNRNAFVDIGEFIDKPSLTFLTTSINVSDADGVARFHDVIVM